MKISAKQSPVDLLAGLGPIGENRRADVIKKLWVPEEREEDQVVLSSAAREVKEVLRRIRSLPDGAGAAVAALKKQVQRHTYPFDFPLIARKMMTEQLVNQAL